MSSVANKVVVITGAGSGIGRALALELGTRGARVAISDVDADGLAETERQVRVAGAEVHARTLDVSERQGFAAYADEVAAHFGVVHQLYNNAGIGSVARPVLELDYESYERVLRVNLMGVIHGTKEFLRHLIASGAGHVVNISSLNGYMGQPNLSAYCTSKFAVRGFSESLRAEMMVARHPVRVTVVHPGGVKTNIASSGLAELARLGGADAAAQRRRIEIYNAQLLKTSAYDAARTIVLGVEAGRARVLVGRDAKTVDILVRTLPAYYTRLVAYWERKTFASNP